LQDSAGNAEQDRSDFQARALQDPAIGTLAR